MRLLITSHPGFGHVSPAVALGKKALQRGHQVAVATGPAYRNLVEGAGLTFFAAGEDWDQSTLTEMPPWLMIVEKSPPKFVCDLMAIAQAWQPDLIIREETELAGWVVADALNIKLATLGLGGNIPPAAFVGRAATIFRELRRQVGAAPDPQMQTIHQNLYFDQYPAGWVAEQFRPKGIYHTIGAAVPGSRPMQHRDSSKEGPPHIYCTLGTVHNRAPGLIAMILQALTDLKLAATVTLGRNADLSAYNVASHIKLATFIPQDEVLPTASAVLCHAGTGTVLGALRHGLPLVVVPIAANQGWTAQLSAENHVAVRLLGKTPQKGMGPGLRADLKTITRADIKTALQCVLQDAAYRRNAESVGAELVETWESGKAIDLLEHLVVSGGEMCHGR